MTLVTTVVVSGEDPEEARTNAEFALEEKLVSAGLDVGGNIVAGRVEEARDSDLRRFAYVKPKKTYYQTFPKARERRRR